jgi:hypothetical protein
VVDRISEYFNIFLRKAETRPTIAGMRSPRPANFENGLNDAGKGVVVSPVCNQNGRPAIREKFFTPNGRNSLKSLVSKK